MEFAFPKNQSSHNDAHRTSCTVFLSPSACRNADVRCRRYSETRHNGKPIGRKGFGLVRLGALARNHLNVPEDRLHVELAQPVRIRARALIAIRPVHRPF